MQKFFTDTLESRYIKALLYNTYIPKYNYVIDEDYVVEGIRYCYGNNIILCTKTGLIGSTATYSIIQDMDRWAVDLKTHENFLSKESYYDSLTHKYLGKYLRYFRGRTGIDLMPLYNCFSNEILSDIKIDENGVKKSVNAPYKVLQIPIKFNTPYTIAIDCIGSCYITSAFIQNGDFLLIGDENISENLTSVVSYSELSFLKPVLYQVNTDNASLYRHENYLTLLIQLPANNNSSITVLEGDYTNLCRKHISTEYIVEDVTPGEYIAVSNNNLDYISQKEKNRLFVSNLSLLRMNDRQSYAFSDKLISYLLSCTITSQEDIRNNIYRLQEAINIGIYNDSIKDVWDDYLRKVIYDNYLDYMENTKDTAIDILGYADKDIEKFLFKY